METLGKHVILELANCDRKTLDNIKLVEFLLREAANVAHATILDFASHKFEPEGVTAFLLLSESHISIHTWPEKGYAAIDIYTCGEHTDPLAAAEFLTLRFRGEADIKIFSRGLK